MDREDYKKLFEKVEEFEKNYVTRSDLEENIKRLKIPANQLI